MCDVTFTKQISSGNDFPEAIGTENSEAGGKENKYLGYN